MATKKSRLDGFESHWETKYLQNRYYKHILADLYCKLKHGNSVFERVNQSKYLVVTLDPCLSWNDHIDYIASKISARIGMLRNVRKVIPREACITLYDAMISPLYDYCSAIWDSCRKVNKDYLDKLQRRAARLIEG